MGGKGQPFLGLMVSALLRQPRLTTNWGSVLTLSSEGNGVKLIAGMGPIGISLWPRPAAIQALCRSGQKLWGFAWVLWGVELPILCPHAEAA